MAVYLVTGGCGFIGSNFVHYLAEKYEDASIVVVDNLSPSSNKANLDPVRDRAQLEVADICDYQAMDRVYREHQPEFVVNFAAESHNDRAIIDPSSFARTNALGAQTLLEASRTHPVRRHLHVSTIEVYGEMADRVPFFTESSPLNAKTPYSGAKAAGDMLVRAYMQTYPEMDIVMTHCANNYGPYQFPEKLIPLSITNIRREKPCPLYGDGLQRRDWLHVLDHCRAIDMLLQIPRPAITAEAAFDSGQLPIFDISARMELTNKEIVTRVIEYLDRDPEQWIEYVADRPNHDRRYLINPEKIEKDVGWHPSVDFEEGLQETVDWYVENETWWQEILSRTGSLQFDWSR